MFHCGKKNVSATRWFEWNTEYVEWQLRQMAQS